ncbi:HK97 gp10 family phage protein [Actinotalea sp. JY-7876]|uniref:HK97 gp10 family phage protein n=1 Tax=Actinotalea sp. JY-7876 TaxID=2758442 RepID=UPI0015F55222|nr:HK97 gp10 family phage protein [Actinotalea sp. JY-7876]
MTSRDADLTKLASDLNRLPANLRRAVRPKVREAGGETLRVAQANARWSSRIPAALSLRTSFGARAAGATVVASTAIAPHARVYEGMVHDSFRHPVFARAGRGAEWVSQAARPYVRPAAKATGQRFVEATNTAIDEALTASGFTK